MRKLLDWIADKLGYQRKFTFKPWPLTFIPASVMEEWEDDDCLPPDFFHDYMRGTMTKSEKEFIEFRSIDVVDGD